MVGSKFVNKETLKLTFVIINDLGKDQVLVLNYKKIIDYNCHAVQVLSDAEILTKQIIASDYVEFDSPEYHQLMKILEKSALG